MDDNVMPNSILGRTPPVSDTVAANAFGAVPPQGDGDRRQARGERAEGHADAECVVNDIHCRGCHAALFIGDRSCPVCRRPFTIPVPSQARLERLRNGVNFEVCAGTYAQGMALIADNFVFLTTTPRPIPAPTPLPPGLKPSLAEQGERLRAKLIAEKNASEEEQERLRRQQVVHTSRRGAFRRILWGLAALTGGLTVAHWLLLH